MNRDTVQPWPLGAMARRLSVSPKWLKEEADAGRIPCVRAGDSRLFDPHEVEKIITKRLKDAAREVRP